MRGGIEITEVFARKASGLVREASLLDTFGIGFMNNGIGVGIWTMASWGLFIYPQGNMMWASIIATIMCVFGIALVWGFLGGSMPRSGGDYIANSRILHPAIGIAMSMTNAGFVMTMWIATLGPWMADPGMTSLLGSLRADPNWILFFQSPEGIFLMATVTNIWGFFIVVLGLKVYNWNQRIVMFAGFFCLIVAGIVLSTATHDDFVTKYNDMAAAAGSMDYQTTIDTVRNVDGVALATTSDLDWYSTLGLFPAVAWATAYGYQITFICGEVKRPQRNIVLGQALAAIIPGFFLVWFSVSMVNVMGQDFLGAVAYMDNMWEGAGYENYTMPVGLNTYGIISILTDNSGVQFIIGLTFILFDMLWMPISYIAFSRAAFAWGMDRLGPSWMADVSPRWRSPVKNNVVMLVMSEIGIVLYATNPDYLLGIAIVALEAMSAWGMMAISALVFPYSKRAKTIWEASPYKFRLGPIYVITIAAIINLIFVGLLIFYFFINENLGAINGPGLVVYIIIWAFSIIWYFAWVNHWKKKGVDLSLAWKELPPA